MGAFDGRAAIVTGGGSGIGRAVATRLAREGANVVVADIDEPSGMQTAHAIGGTFVATDVAAPGDLERVVQESVTKHGRLDIVHLNAGITTGDSSMKTLSIDAYKKAVGVNVDGVVFGVMAAAPAIEQGGAIIATASLAGLVAYPGDPIYGLTKHAVVGFVRAVAEQLSVDGVTINAVCPGFVDTPILGGFADEFRAAGFPLLEADEVAESVVQIITSGRTGEVFVCQPGRLCEPYGFRGVPGPRTAGSEGMAPPVHPSV
jgi:NAD(P)-dependent dehydrogenase (short-subunit alcohol dehydrogenase family)